MRPKTGLLAALLATLVLSPLNALASGDAAAPAVADPSALGPSTLAAVWLIVAAILVFWMQAGFSLFEAGFCRAKNVVNVLMKNLMVLSLGSVAFCTLGFGIMFGASSGWFGSSGFFFAGLDADATGYAFLLFQTMVCVTAITIVSGALAERTKFSAYLIASVCIAALVYPVFGAWAWGGLLHGGGWLQGGEHSLLLRLGLPPFIDFAGSSVVHSLGGWAALAGAIILGPRTGKYDEQGNVKPLLGHSMVLSCLGCFILWMGWFGFNAGASLVASDASLGASRFVTFGLVALNTTLAAGAAASSATLTGWSINGNPDIGTTLNGALAGLVAVSAGCAYVTPAAALAIGFVAGSLVVASVLLFDRRGIDDPIGAISVHGVCGFWGTLAVGIFHAQGPSIAQLLSQSVGALACFMWSFGTSYLLFSVLRLTSGLRVSVEAEIDGLDLHEHGADAYPQDISPEPRTTSAAQSFGGDDVAIGRT
jgi:Amt family ammonium transporter